MNAHTQHDADIVHPGTIEPGYEGMHVGSTNTTDLNIMVETLAKDGWETWIKGEQDGKPAAYLYRKKQSKKE